MAFYLTSQRATILKHPKWGSEAADLMPHLMDVPSKARGFLLKLSSKKKWVKRFFHLRGHYLIYFGSVAASRKGLPKDADENSVSAMMENGCLHVNVAKTDEAHSKKKIPILEKEN